MVSTRGKAGRWRRTVALLIATASTVGAQTWHAFEGKCSGPSSGVGGPLLCVPTSPHYDHVVCAAAERKFADGRLSFTATVYDHTTKTWKHGAVRALCDAHKDLCGGYWLDEAAAPPTLYLTAASSAPPTDCAGNPQGPLCRTWTNHVAAAVPCPTCRCHLRAAATGRCASGGVQVGEQCRCGLPADPAFAPLPPYVANPSLSPATVSPPFSSWVHFGGDAARTACTAVPKAYTVVAAGRCTDAQGRVPHHWTQASPSGVLSCQNLCDCLGESCIGFHQNLVGECVLYNPGDPGRFEYTQAQLSNLYQSYHIGATAARLLEAGDGATGYTCHVKTTAKTHTPVVLPGVCVVEAGYLLTGPSSSLDACVTYFKGDAVPSTTKVGSFQGSECRKNTPGQISTISSECGAAAHVVVRQPDVARTQLFASRVCPQHAVPITTLAVCQAAVEALSLKYTKSGVRLVSDYPVGCWIDGVTGATHFNGAEGSTDPNMACHDAGGKCFVVCDTRPKEMLTLVGCAVAATGTPAPTSTLVPVGPRRTHPFMTAADCFVACLGSPYSALRWDGVALGCWCGQSAHNDAKLTAPGDAPVAGEPTCAERCSAASVSGAQKLLCVRRVADGRRPCFKRVAQRKRCRNEGTAQRTMAHLLPAFSYEVLRREQCEALCASLEGCSHYNWAKYAAAREQCELVFSGCTEFEPAVGLEVYARKLCAEHELPADHPTLDSPAPQLGGLQNGGGACGRKAYDTLLDSEYGYCNTQPRLEGLTCMQVAPAELSAQRVGSAVILDTNNALWCRCASGFSCEQDGLCHKPGTYTPPPVVPQVTMLQVDTPVGELVGPGLCAGDRWSRYCRLTARVDRHGLTDIPVERLQEGCLADVAAAVGSECGVVGVDYRWNRKNGLRCCIYASSAGLSFVGFSLFNPRVTPSSAMPQAVKPTGPPGLPAACYNYWGRAASCGARRLGMCPLHRVRELGLTIDPPELWPAGTRTMHHAATMETYRLLPAGVATCETAGYRTITTQAACHRAICAAANDTIMPSPVLGVNSGTVQGCVRPASASASNPPYQLNAAGADDCTAAGVQCLCALEHIQLSTCSGAPAGSGYYLKTSGPGCTLEDDDITDEAECREAACTLLGRAPAPSKMGYLEAYPLVDSAGRHHAYSGRYRATAGTWQASTLSPASTDGWRGGCSAQRLASTKVVHAVWFVPRNVCPGLSQAECAAKKECAWQGAQCANARGGFSLCTTASPCLCKSRPVPGGPSPPETPPVSENCAVHVEPWASGEVQVCDGCPENASDDDLCGQKEGVPGDFYDKEVTLKAGQTVSLIFNSYADPSSILLVKKHFIAGKVRLAVRFGLEPSKEFYACTHWDEHQSDSVCRQRACGPFAVTLTALETAARVHLSVCSATQATYPRWSTPSKARGCCGGVSNGGAGVRACRFKYPVPTIEGKDVSKTECACDNRHDGLECNECKQGGFPAPTCTLKCHTCGDVPCGHYVPETNANACTCLPNTGLVGTLCDKCAEGKVGVMCTDEVPILDYTIDDVSFTAQSRQFTPPAWAVVPNSVAHITFPGADPKSFVRVRASAKKNLADAAANAAVQASLDKLMGQVTSGSIRAAYWGPAPSERAGSSTVYLHVFLSGNVHRYTYSESRDDDGELQYKFKLDYTASVKDYYAGAGISACQQAFGDDYDSGYDAAFYLQRPSAASRADTERLVFVKGDSFCAADARHGNLQFDTHSSASTVLDSLLDISVRGPGSSPTNLLRAGYKSDVDRWDAVTALSSGGVNVLAFVQGSAVRRLNADSHCCGAKLSASDLEKVVALTTVQAQFGAGASLPRLTAAAGRLAEGDDAPVTTTVLFSHQAVYIHGKMRAASGLFEGISLPTKLEMRSALPAPESGVHNVHAYVMDELQFRMALRDSHGEQVPLEKDAVVPTLLSCHAPLTAAQTDAKTLLEKRTNGESLDDFIYTEADCVPATDGVRLAGPDARGVLADDDPVMDITFSGLTITRGGRYKIAFTHLKSGVKVTTGLIIVKDTPCDSAKLWPDATECFVDCLAEATGGAEPRCKVPLSNNKNWLELEVISKGYAVLDVQLRIQQPCCSQNGLCCASVGVPCDEHANAAYAAEPTTRCQCFGTQAKGFWDPRAGSSCAACKAGFSLASGCKTFDEDVVSEILTPTATLGEGKDQYYLLEVSPETPFSVDLANTAGDADFAVLFDVCPGQAHVLQKEVLEAGEVAVPCGGRGDCLFHEDNGPVCACYDGHRGTACEEVCCSKHGQCGNKCVCHAHPVDGHWAGSATACMGAACTAPGGADLLPADECAFASVAAAADPPYKFRACADGGVQAESNAALRSWFSWRGLKAAAEGSLLHAAVTWEEADRSCTEGQTVYVYATVDTTQYADSAKATYQGLGSSYPCGVAYTGTAAAPTCASDATFDAAMSTCVCTGVGDRCILGSCSNKQRCDVGGAVSCESGSWTFGSNACACGTQQADSGELSGLSCDGGLCQEEVQRLAYTWREGDVVSKDFTEGTLPEQLQWVGVDGRHATRFHSPVATFSQGVPVAGRTVEVDVSAWMAKNTAHIKSGTFDLSFVFVTLHGAKCQMRTKGKPSLLLKNLGVKQPSRLYMSKEVSALSAQQQGNPYYALYTADTGALGNLASSTPDQFRRVPRYVPGLTRPTTALSCGAAAKVGSETCTCPKDAAFQDPTDYVQVGDQMFFLAVTDWEETYGDAPCKPAYDADAGGIFQGPRELFYTRGLPRSAAGDASASRTATRHGGAVYPSFENKEQEVRESLLSQKVFTRMKELTKMANPACTPGAPCAAHKEMLVYTAAHRGGDSVSLLTGDAQPVIQSGRLFPELWRVRLAADGTPQPAERVTEDVMFPHYLTAVNVAAANSAAAAEPSPLLLFLAQKKPASVADADYSPLGSERGYGGARPDHQYLVATRLDVYATDGAGKPTLVVAAAADNVPRCEHQQGHPGFVAFKNKVYFHFDDGSSEGLRLYVWDPQTPAVQATPVALEVTPLTGGKLRPWIPPLNKGYFKPVVSQDGNFLFLALSAGGVVEDTGGCRSVPACTHKEHLFQKAFACVKKERGQVRLWWWDGATATEAAGVHLGQIGGRDPKWTHATKTGVFFVAHDDALGMTNVGVKMSKTVGGVVFPAEQVVEDVTGVVTEKQSLFFFKFAELVTNKASPTLTTVMSTTLPVEPYSLTTMGDKVYFWAYKGSELAAGYGNTGTCYPPGRVQSVKFRENPSDPNSALHVTNVVSGVNVPAYDGCSRTLYSVAAENPTTASEELSGGPQDGVGVPAKQCCGKSFMTDLGPDAPWPATAGTMDSGGANQAGRMCKLGDNGCSSMFFQTTPDLPRGCSSACYVPRSDSYPPTANYLADDFLYPTFKSPDRSAYSVAETWRRPHSGWWFTGFQSIWVDARVAKASGQAVTADGWSKGDHIRGKEVYRPGGFAFREHWPTVLGAFVQPAAVARDDCDDCAPNYYGRGCTWKCDDCGGYPCNDGVYGDGSCQCPPGTGPGCQVATTPLRDPVKQTMHRVTVDGFVKVVNNGMASPSTVTLTSSDCAASCGADGASACCGRGSEPLRVSTEHWTVLGFEDVVVTGALVSGHAVLRLHELPSPACAAPVTVQVYLLDGTGMQKSFVEGDVSGFNPWVAYDASVSSEPFPRGPVLPTAEPSVLLGTYQTTGTAHGAAYIPLSGARLVQYFPPTTLSGGKVYLALRLAPGSDAGCVLRYSAKEHFAGWEDDCAAAGGVGCTDGRAVPRSAAIVDHSDQGAVLFLHSNALTIVSTGGTTTGGGGTTTGGGGTTTTTTGGSVPQRYASTLGAPHAGESGLATVYYGKRPLTAAAWPTRPPTSTFNPTQPAPYLREAFRARELACQLLGEEEAEKCYKITPLDTGFAYVKVSGLVPDTKYTLRTTHTPRGRFTPEARHGKCVRDAARGGGSFGGSLCVECAHPYAHDLVKSVACSLYTPAACGAACVAASGTCVEDLSTGYIHERCKCPVGYYGPTCAVRCDAATCSTNGGRCTETGECVCRESSLDGYWATDPNAAAGTPACSICLPGYQTVPDGPCGAKCACRKEHGTCDPNTGLCVAGTCTAGRKGTKCQSCTVGYKMTSAQKCVACTDENCPEKEVCSDEGACVCPEASGYYRTSKGCVHCEAAVTCNGKGACVSNVTAANPCVCSQRYDGVDCKLCRLGAWGEQCEKNCWCNNHGRCDANGDCKCFDTDGEGHWDGQRCDRCLFGFTGSDCRSTGAVLSRKRLGKAFEFTSDEVTKKKVVPQVRGSVFHTTQTQAARKAGADPATHDNNDAMWSDILDKRGKEFILASCGDRQVTERRLPIEMWAKQLSTNVDFGDGSVASFSVHTFGENNAFVGDSVVGMFQHGEYMHFVAQDAATPYVGRTFASFGDQCQFCLASCSTDWGSCGLRYASPSGALFGPGSTCEDGACPAGTLVHVDGKRAVVLPLSGGGCGSGCVWVRYEDLSPCASGCHEGQLTAHSIDGAVLQPVRAVRFLKPKTNTALPGHVAVRVWRLVAHAAVESSGWLYTVLQEVYVTKTSAREAKGFFLYVVKLGAGKSGVDGFEEPQAEALPLPDFVDVQALHAYSDGEADKVFVFGVSQAGTMVMQTYLPPPDASKVKQYGSFTPAPLAACLTRACLAVERIGAAAATPSREVIVLIRAAAACVGSLKCDKPHVYVAQRLDLSAKGGVAPLSISGVCTGATETKCVQMGCLWHTVGAESRCVRRSERTVVEGAYSGVGALSYDSEGDMLYFSLGTSQPTKPSILYKLDTRTLVPVLDRNMSYGHVAEDVEALVASHFDVQRRALFALAHYDRTTVSVVNGYDVLGVNPDVADAPTAGTNVTVYGIGYSKMRGRVTPQCRMGDSLASRAWFEDLPSGELVIVCTAAVPATHSPCTPVPIEVSLTGGDAAKTEETRWTETRVWITRSSRVLILPEGGLGTKMNAKNGSWVFPHADGALPAVANKIADPAHRATVTQTDLTVSVPGPVTDPYGLVPTKQPLLSTTQQVCSGPSGQPVVVTVVGAGFIEASSFMCKFGDREASPGTYLSAMRALCLQPAAPPQKVVVEIALDGQVFSQTKVPYYIVGPPTDMRAFFHCDAASKTASCDAQTEAHFRTPNDATVVWQNSEAVTTLLPITAIFTDVVGTFVGSVWNENRAPGSAQLRLPTSLVVNTGSISKMTVPVENGRATFSGIELVEPKAGEYSITVRYNSTSDGIWSKVVKVWIEGAIASGISFDVTPAAFSNNRGKLSRQPKVRIRDVAGNSVKRPGYTIVASLSDVPGELGHSSQPAIEVVGETAFAGDTFDFTQLAVQYKDSIPAEKRRTGRKLQFRTLDSGLEELITFKLVFEVFKGTGADRVKQEDLQSLTHTMHFVDCSVDNVARNRLAWVEPEEQAVSTSASFTIKGWEFKDVGNEGSYRCQIRSAVDDRFVASIAATYLDSCSLECNPENHKELYDAPSMLKVRPALCCTKDGTTGRVTECPGQPNIDARNCLSTGDAFASWNETTLTTDFFHRYVGPAAKMKVWNLRRSLPAFERGSHPCSSALDVLLETSQVAPVRPELTTCMRVSKSVVDPDYLTTQNDIDAWNYTLNMFTDSVVNRDTVLRAAERVTIAGKKFWVDNDWALSSRVSQLPSLKPEIDTSFRIGLVDEAVGLNAWQGTWVSAHEQLASGTATPGRTVTMEVLPQFTTASPVTGLQYASVKEGKVSFVSRFTVGDLPESSSATKKMTNSYCEFGDVVLKQPAKGDYIVRFKYNDATLPDVDVNIKILEGLPHRVVFDSVARGGQDGVPKSTLSSDKALVVQPRFVLLDAVDNVVQLLPSKHAIFARVKSITPWPRCVAECATPGCVAPGPTTPGWWGVEDRTRQGVCLWNTPPPSDKSDEAVRVRRLHEPSFDSSGIATYGTSMNVWADPAYRGTYGMVFEFYGPGLDVGLASGTKIADLPLPAPLRVSICEACSPGVRVCTVSPKVMDPSKGPAELTIFGDYYDFAKGKRSDSQLRVQMRFQASQKELICEVSAELVDACSIIATIPTCQYMCVNHYPPSRYTAEDRVACCANGVKADGVTLCVASTASNPTVRAAEALQNSAFFAALGTPARVALRVATACAATGTCLAELNAQPWVTGPPRLGVAAQLGVHGAEVATGLATSGSRASQQRLAPIRVEVKAKDVASSDVGTRDGVRRRVNLYLQKQLATSGSSTTWSSANCVTNPDTCLPHARVEASVCDADPARECVFFEDDNGTRTDNTAEMTDGVAVFFVVLQAPSAGEFAVQATDVTPVGETGFATARLPPCAGPHIVGGVDRGAGVDVKTANGTFRFPYVDSAECSATRTFSLGFASLSFFTVTYGEPHKFEWVDRTLVSELTANTQSIVEYAFYVKDFAGNVLEPTQVALGGVASNVFLNVSRTVPELRGPHAAALLERRGEEATEENIRRLEVLACEFNVTNGDGTGRTTVMLGGDIQTQQVKFTVRSLRIWRGMSCQLTFMAAPGLPGAGQPSGVQRNVSEILNTNSQVSVTIKPSPCCGNGTACSQFAYSFEYGCFNQKLGRVLSGPKNPSNVGVLARINKVNKYECLYECGECEAGMVCFGNTTVHNVKGYWREPVSYRGWECKQNGCHRGSLGRGLQEGEPSAIGLADDVRSTVCGV